MGDFGLLVFFFVKRFIGIFFLVMTVYWYLNNHIISFYGKMGLTAQDKRNYNKLYHHCLTKKKLYHHYNIKYLLFFYTKNIYFISASSLLRKKSIKRGRNENFLFAYEFVKIVFIKSYIKFSI